MEARNRDHLVLVIKGQQRGTDFTLVLLGKDMQQEHEHVKCLSDKIVFQNKEDVCPSLSSVLYIIQTFHQHSAFLRKPWKQIKCYSFLTYFDILEELGVSK